MISSEEFVKQIDTTHLVDCDGFYFYPSISMMSKALYTNDMIDEMKTALIDHINKEKQIQRRYDEDDVTILHIIPTTRCDGKCTYCYAYALGNLEKNGNLNLNCLKKTCATYKNINYVRFYGGEPLLNTELCDMISFLDKTYNLETIYISTGLLFDDDIFYTQVNNLKKTIKHIKTHISMGVTVDLGSFTRICSSCDITRKKLYERLKYIRDICPKIELKTSTVLNSYTEFSKFKEDLFIYKQLFPNIFMRIMVASDTEFYPSEQLIDNVFSVLLNEENIISNIFPYTDIVTKPRILRFNKDSIFLQYPVDYCGVNTRTICIWPGGKTTSCHMNKEETDYLEHTDVFCEACNFYPICRGGCKFRRYEFNNESRKIYCKWIKLSYVLSLIKNKSTFEELLM